MASRSLPPSDEVLTTWNTVKQALGWAELTSAAWSSIAEKLGDAKLDNLDHLAAIKSHDMQQAISAARLSRRKLSPLERARASLVYNAARAKHNLELADVAASIEEAGANSQKRPVSLPEQSKSSKPRVSDPVKLTVCAPGGSECHLFFSASSLIADVKKDACSRLGLSSATARVVFGNAPLRDEERLDNLGIGTDSLLTIVVEDFIVVKRHVYNARGGAPPYRGSHLTATDTVSLLRSLPLKDQMTKIIPPDGMPDSDEEQACVTTLQKAWRGNVEEPAPQKWESRAAAIDANATAAQVFQGGNTDVVVLIPMRGCD